MPPNSKIMIRIGTSNIVLPGNKQTFPDAFRSRTRLHYYASLFNTVELNSSFYKVPMPATFEKWSMDVPVNFQFTVKLWKEITHVKNLDYDPANITRFMLAADRIGNKKGCLLIQFPGLVSFDHFNKVELILDRIAEADPKNTWRKAIEFRNDSWYTGETFEMLDQYKASLVIHDIPKGKNTVLNKKASFVNIRYHGPAGDYRGSYSDVFLQQQSFLIKDLHAKGKNVYAYFNNTIGSAFENAMTLQRMVS